MNDLLIILIAAFQLLFGVWLGVRLGKQLERRRILDRLDGIVFDELSDGWDTDAEPLSFTPVEVLNIIIDNNQEP